MRIRTSRTSIAKGARHPAAVGAGSADAIGEEIEVEIGAVVADAAAAVVVVDAVAVEVDAVAAGTAAVDMAGMVAAEVGTKSSHRP